MAPSLSQCGSISLAGAPMHETLPHLHVSTVVRAAAAAVSGISGSQERAYKKLYAKLKHQKQVKIVALGGSMLVGMGCRDLNVSAWASGPSRACSYPDRFANLLHDAHYSEENGSNVFYVNRATGSTTTAAALPMMDSLLTTDVEAPTAEHPDLLLIDYSVNDQDLEQDASPRRRQGSPSTTRSTRQMSRCCGTYLLARQIRQFSLSRVRVWRWCAQNRGWTLREDASEGRSSS